MNRFLHGISEAREVVRSLSPASQRRLWLLLLLIVLRAGIEVAGLASAYPLLALLAHPESFWDSVPGRWLMAVTGAPDPARLLPPLAAIYALLLGASAVAAALILVQQYRFTYALQTEVATRLLAGYLAKPYEFFLQRNVSVLTKNMTVSVSDFSAGFVLHGLFFVSSAIVLSGLVAALLVFSPQITLAAVAFLAAIYALILFVLRQRVARWAGERDRQMGDMFKSVEDALAGIRDVKVSGSERFLLDRFRVHAARYAALNVRFQAANAVPSQFALAAVMLGVAALLSVLMVQDIRAADVIPTLGVFYIAFSRMLPLGNQLYTNWATTAYFWPSIGIVHMGLVESGGETDAARRGKACALDGALPFVRTLKFEDVYYRYPSASCDAVSALSWEIRFGRQVALIGRSGAGKSTVLDLLLGLILPTKGSILIDGVPLTEEAISAWRRQIGYVPQQPFFFDASIAENIAFGLKESEIDWQRLEEAVAAAALTRVVSELPQGLRTPIGDRGIRLSGGERQRVAIARALYRRPRLLVLDEATSALDIETERAILAEVAGLKGRITTIVVTHRPEALRYCDAVIRIEAGRIANADSHPLADAARAGGRKALTGEPRG